MPTTKFYDRWGGSATKPAASLLEHIHQKDEEGQWERPVMVELTLCHLVSLAPFTQSPGIWYPG